MSGTAKVSAFLRRRRSQHEIERRNARHWRIEALPQSQALSVAPKGRLTISVVILESEVAEKILSQVQDREKELTAIEQRLERDIKMPVFAREKDQSY